MIGYAFSGNMPCWFRIDVCPPLVPEERDTATT